MTSTTVRDAAFDVLREYGLTTLFANPGSTEISLLADLPDDLRFVLGLHESSVVGMATGWALGRREPVVVTDYGDLPAPIPLEALYDLAPWLAVPIFWQGVITGVFGICAADPSRRFTDADVQVLTLFAKHAAVAIENARLYQQSRELAVTEERNRLAREIHDTLLQSLAAIGVELETIATELDPVHSPAREGLRRLRRQVGHCLREARESILELRRDSMKPRALVDSLRELAENLERRCALAALDPRDVRGTAPRERDVPLTEPSRGPCGCQPLPDPCGVVHVGNARSLHRLGRHERHLPPKPP